MKQQVISRVFTIGFAVLSMLVFASGNNLLINGSFETGDLTGWTDGAAAEGSATVGAPANVGAQDGDFAALITLGGNVGELRQTFPASPGEEFNFSGWMLTEAQLPGGPSFGVYKIVFRDENDNDLPPASVSIGQENFDFPGVESLPFCDFNTPVDTWIFSEAQGVAPAGTTKVLFLVLNVDFGEGENPIWFDNVQASQVEGGEGTNLLVNGSFETGDISGWVNLPPAGGGSATVGAPAVGAQDGDFAAEISLASGVGELRQTFAANPGDEFNFSGWMLTENALPNDVAFGLFKIVFRDAGGADLAPESVSIGQENFEFPGVESLPFCNFETPVNTWIFSEAQGVAPAGTTQVVLLALNVDFAPDGPHPIWFDNIQASLVNGGGFCPPTSFIRFRGTDVGTPVLADFVDSDDVYASYKPGFVLNSAEAPVWLEFLANCPTATDFSVESNAGTPGLTYTVEALNYPAGGNPVTDYDVIGSSAESFNTDTVVTFPIVAGDHIDTDGSVRCRVGWRKTGLTINFPWQVNVDQVGWNQ